MELEREMKNCPGRRIGDEEEEGVRGERAREGGGWGTLVGPVISDVLS